LPSHSAGEFLVNLFRAIGSPGYPIDETWLREMGWQSYDRADDPGGGQRQIAAV
jgi:hypothetical protein